ncbi:MAG: hypothetical protein K0S76_3108 [Herbinix sp.]|jgi:hypothetical protein|nr:hypothetical protein [Herbinix sp.]
MVALIIRGIMQGDISNDGISFSIYKIVCNTQLSIFDHLCWLMVHLYSGKVIIQGKNGNF